MNIPISCDPLITSVCLEHFEYGVQCAKLLLDVIADSEMIFKDVLIPYSLSIGKSVRNV